jgi:hypothetical protein
MGWDTIKIVENGVEKDSVVRRSDTYYTHTDANGYFKAIAPTQQYGLIYTPQPYPGFWHIEVSAAGATVYGSSWRNDGNIWKDVPYTITLNKINYDVAVKNETILSGQNKTYTGRNSLTVSNTTVQSGGKATFTSARVVELRPGFMAQAGSWVHVYIDNTPPCDELSFQTSKDNLLQSVKSGFLNESKSFNLVFETTILENSVSIFPNPTNSTVTVQLHSSNSDASLKSVKLMDLTGREILLQLVTGQFYTLDISLYSKGLYFIQIKDETTVYNRKLIIQ